MDYEKAVYTGGHILAGVGAINWGLVGTMDVNLVTMAFGSGSLLTTGTYTLVGLGGIQTLADGVMNLLE